MCGFDGKLVLKQQLMAKVIHNSCSNSQRKASTQLRLDMLFQNRIILDVGGFPYFAFSQAQPFVAVKSKAMACNGLQCRFACKQSHLVFCNFFFCLLVGFTVTKAVLDFAGQFIAFDIPNLPPSVFSLENVFTFLRCLNPPAFIV